jgi:hypothetical protein
MSAWRTKRYLLVGCGDEITPNELGYRGLGRIEPAPYGHNNSGWRRRWRSGFRRVSVKQPNSVDRILTRFRAPLGERIQGLTRLGMNYLRSLSRFV